VGGGRGGGEAVGEKGLWEKEVGGCCMRGAWRAKHAQRGHRHVLFLHAKHMQLTTRVQEEGGGEAGASQLWCDEVASVMRGGGGGHRGHPLEQGAAQG
jgi:hypothetical protein